VTIQSPTAKDADRLNKNPGSVDTEKPVAGLRRSIQSRMHSLFRQWPGVVAAGSIALLVAAAYLIAPPMGRDLAAQVAMPSSPERIGLSC
jgi:hypothetical protein